MTRIIHIVPSIAEEASGPSYSVLRLCESLIGQGEELSLFALDWSPLKEVPNFLNTFKIDGAPKRLGRSQNMRHALLQAINEGSPILLHNHGLWTMPNIYPGRVAQMENTKLVAAPRGAMSEWAMANGSWAKKLFWPLLQKPSLQQVACFHATCQSEYDDIRRLGFEQPVAIIPNGIDIPILEDSMRSRERILLFLGRIHPVKGLDLLLPAWKTVQGQAPDWSLHIVGSDHGYHGPSGYLNEMKTLSKYLELERVFFMGELTGPRKWQEYQNAELFVLPTYSENFGIAVAEALAAGTPAIVSKGAPWQGLDEHAAGWWIDQDLDALVQTLKLALRQEPETLAAMGMRGRTWMEQDFSWDKIAQRMKSVYRWVMEGDNVQPDCVHIN